MARFLELRHLLWAYPCGDNDVAPSTWTVGSNTKNVFGAKCKIAIFFSDLHQKIVLESGIVDGATPNCRQLSTIDGANHMHGTVAPWTLQPTFNTKNTRSLCNNSYVHERFDQFTIKQYTGFWDCAQSPRNFHNRWRNHVEQKHTLL